MTIEKTVDIPADYRLTLEIPHTVPRGKARLEIIITPCLARPLGGNPAGLAPRGKYHADVF
jgi:hypothetical protein